MKTTIEITGQISGNRTLYNRLLMVGNRVESYRERMFNGKQIVFETKRAAKQALWKAFTSLCAEDPAKRNIFGGIVYYPGHALNYDASKAIIQINI